MLMYDFFDNPIEQWEASGMKDLSDDEKMEVARKTIVYGCGLNMLIFIVMLVFLSFLTGCTATKYVPVHDTHDVHHWHTDSVVQADSTIINSQTVIMQLDSETMAKYGIQLKDAERAWLVKTQEMERQLRQFERLSADRDTVRDSIAVPYPVEVIKEVEKPFTCWQTALMWIGFAAIIVLLIIFVRR